MRPLLVIALTAALAAAADRKPNVLVIVSDDLGYADVGFQGCKDIPTPNLDALARPGSASPTATSPGRTARRRGPGC